MNTVIPEAGITLNSRLFGEDIVVLAFQVADNLLKSDHNNC